MESRVQWTRKRAPMLENDFGRRRYARWRLLALSAVAATATACKSDSGVIHEIVEYATTPCPFGTNQIVSTDSGTPGLKKFTEKWCERMDDHGEHIRHGPYVELYETGGKREYGRFRDGKRDGSWTRWHPSGKVDAVTLWDNGKPVSFEAWHVNGQKWEQGSFVDGFKQGMWSRWHVNGQKEVESYFEHGTLDRRYTVWHDNGQKEQQGEYKMGVRDGLWVSWHRNGQKRQEILFHGGKPDDWYRAWHENGQQSQQALFHDGKPEGEYVLWHDNGQREEAGSYHNGMLDGPITAWDRNGNVWMKTEYKGGTQVEEPPSPLADLGAPREDGPTIVR
jgi:antitoxin component YwqK of YwqJK toxin-antitoxin module